MSANRELLDRYGELYNAGDLDGVMELYAEDFVQYMPDGEDQSVDRDSGADLKEETCRSR